MGDESCSMYENVNIVCLKEGTFWLWSIIYDYKKY